MAADATHRRALLAPAATRSRPRPLDDLSDLRVALFTDTWAPQVNGVTRTLRRLTDALRERGAGVRVVTIDCPGAPSDDAVRWPSRPFPPYPELRLAGIRTADAERAVRDARATLVHVATPFGVGLAARRAARRLGVPLVSSYHTHFSAYAGFYGLGALARPGWTYLRWFHAAGRRTYVPTHAVARELRAHGFRDLAVWGRGIDVARFGPHHRRAERRDRWGARPHDVVVLYVGRLAREKGLDLALDAVRDAQARLAAIGSEAALRLVLVGDGPYASACRARAPEGTTFAGRLEGAALAEAYASADLFVFPSHTDTFGNVLLEAMASGLAVAAVEAPPSRELLADGARGLLAEPTPAALGAALTRLVRDPSTRRALAASGLAHAATQGWATIFDALFADYRAVAAGWHGAGPAVPLQPADTAGA